MGKIKSWIHYIYGPVRVFVGDCCCWVCQHLLAVAMVTAICRTEWNRSRGLIW